MIVQQSVPFKKWEDAVRISVYRIDLFLIDKIT